MEGGTGIPRIRSGQVLLIAKVLAKWSAWASTSSLRVICANGDDVGVPGGKERCVRERRSVAPHPRGSSQQKLSRPGACCGEKTCSAAAGGEPGSRCLRRRSLPKISGNKAFCSGRGPRNTGRGGGPVPTCSDGPGRRGAAMPAGLRLR